MSLGAVAAIGASAARLIDLLNAPTSLDSGSETTSASSIASSSISPAANSLVICGVGFRSDAEAEVTLGTPVATFGTSGSWVVLKEQYSDGAAWVGGGLAMVMTDGAPGSGTITFSGTGNSFQRCYRVLQATGGLVTPISGYPTDTNEGQATSLAFALPGAPATSSLIISDLIHNSDVGGTFNVPSGHTAFAAISVGTNMAMKMAYLLTGGQQNFSWEGLDLDEGKVGAAVEVLQA